MACEECWLLVGQRRGNIWLCRMLDRSVGRPETVEFDGSAALAREESCRDVVGFLHTHPSSAAKPSQRDLDTMHAWVSAFGKPLLCVIQGTNGLKAFLFEDDENVGKPIPQAERFDGDQLVVVDLTM